MRRNLYVFDVKVGPQQLILFSFFLYLPITCSSVPPLSYHTHTHKYTHAKTHTRVRAPRISRHTHTQHMHRRFELAVKILSVSLSEYSCVSLIGVKR